MAKQIDTGSNQGRIGMESVNASRAIFGMKPLAETDRDQDGLYAADLWRAIVITALLACIFAGGTEWVVAVLSN